jgi:hypothetical protein
MSDRPGTFHQLTQEAKSSLAEAGEFLNKLIQEQRTQQPDPHKMAFLTSQYLDWLTHASRDVTTAAMLWAADRAIREERE